MRYFVFWCHGDGILHEQEFTGVECWKEAKDFYDSLSAWKKEITPRKAFSILHPNKNRFFAA